MARSPLDRFWINVEKTNDCWLWKGRCDQYGYGQFKVADRNLGAHRWLYEQLIGPIPDDLELDHNCHPTDGSCPGGRACPHRRCVNPAHLGKPVTHRQNSLRSTSPQAINAQKTQCDNGHPYDLLNTYIRPNGQRDCRACIRARVAAYKRRKRGVA